MCSSEPGRFCTHAPTSPPRSEAVERGAAWLIDQAGRLGPHAQAWAQSMIQDAESKRCACWWGS